MEANEYPAYGHFYPDRPGQPVDIVLWVAGHQIRLNVTDNEFSVFVDDEVIPIEVKR